MMQVQKNEIAYMINNDLEISYHLAVDDIEVVQGIPFNRCSWNAGDGIYGDGNRKSIAIEICYSKSGGFKFDKAYNNAIELSAQLMKEFGIPATNIKYHIDWSGKYCPHRLLDMGISVEQFRQLVVAKYNEMYKRPTRTQLYRVRKSWPNVKSQIGAFSNLNNAKKVCVNGYSVYDESGNVVYSKQHKTIEELAKDVIAGKYGNGAERKRKIESEGYDYNVVQQKVNEMLSR
jgi:N-acetylmuramoyl-L-alanine amidase CwlA